MAVSDEGSAMDTKLPPSASDPTRASLAARTNDKIPSPVRSAPQLFRQVRAQAGELFRRQGSQHTAPLLGNVRRRARVVAEHILLEKGTPGAPRRGRQGADAEYPVQQYLEGRIRERAVAGLVMPPVVHEHVEALEGLDVVPPERWNEYRVSRPHLGHVGRRQCLAKLRIPRKVGIAQRYQAHRCSRGCKVQRTDVKVCYLLGRKQRETAAPRHDAADVVPLIDVGGSGDLIAQP